MEKLIEKQAVAKDRGPKRRRESVRFGLTPKGGNHNQDFGSDGNTPNAAQGADKLQIIASATGSQANGDQSVTDNYSKADGLSQIEATPKNDKREELLE